MPRHRRLNFPGCIYHVIARGLERRKIFHDDIDRNDFLNRLSVGLKQTGCQNLAWCLMPNHFHLLIRTGNSSLSDLMRKLLSGYAIFFNRRHKRHGYLFQNRYKSILCQEEIYFLELVRYIHLNPYRARLVETIAQLNNYPWIGHSTILGKYERKWQNTEEVIGRFSSKKKDGIQRYLAFLKDGLSMGRREDLIGGGLRRSAGGWAAVKALKKNNDFWRGDERILGNGDFVSNVLKLEEEKLTQKESLLRKGWNLKKIMTRACKVLQLNEKDIDFSARRRQESNVRALIAYWGKKELTIQGADLARFLQTSKPAIVKATQRGRLLVKKNNYKLLS